MNSETKPSIELGNASEMKTDIPNRTNKLNQIVQNANISTQTLSYQNNNESKFTQTDLDQEKTTINKEMIVLKTENEKMRKDLTYLKNYANKKEEDIKTLNFQKSNLENTIENLRDSSIQTEMLNNRLRVTIEELKRQNDNYRSIQDAQQNRICDAANEENKSLLLALKQLENEKNVIVSEYQELLHTERHEYSKSVKDLNTQILELKSKLDR